ncbi:MULTISPECIES: FAD-binding and (Fe-S)-binding domain-containing protein [unclassified Pseudomonas]|uniref:D-2-hydroxyglutarate dehydrogenase YdiJ n=1 Tax=unclassified Pseudomonas TaxID=196821 RepID=UPI000BCBC19C|nr:MULTISPECIES: FAD-binding and (Fe-S)-binding domain-containing protein [unclassified Pseudomonas]PVZ15922.1 FAD/FMN-containing dehydrogenase [Pseudomonas sp. URIL14HWK12:I12]PVZ26222.1 FAD/FMN-containing dehydrogenase [Pseudomonas sp. URIL14HWK12:I10]PVZ36254.1 FAD/FMN-containing dehydrogenase [Pseudomonas sp. URIL14HWK12:I11]SNZ18254.1 FAD/FMN-containing dehydrogenase [Pseudomonas sp. URIL14HWK12:I9]
MIAALQPAAAAASYRDFLAALQSAGFKGEISADYASRTVLATDNSIYQRLPQAAVFPRDADDVTLIARLMGEAAFSTVKLTPRGGGTGTNGQSLTDGIVVDLSRHMNQILEIDVEGRWVRVQAGVVKDQLNAALKPYGLFFAPELSTSNRATVGGMINTDASGQGSCTYGKTRDHVLALDSVLLGGQRLQSQPIDEAELERQCARQDRVGQVYRVARHINDTQGDLIEARFPKLNRCLTGYDLAHLRDEQGRFNLNSVMCGAEGSLGFVVEARLNVLPIPKYSVLVNIRYAGFMDALRDARALLEHKPLSIETVDSKVLLLAMKDIVWHSVAEYFPADEARPTLGINLVEFSGDDAEQVSARVRAFVQHLQSDTGVERLGHTLAEGAEAVNRVYAMRKRSVGLLGNVEGEIRPQPFVEDTAVPPEQLADYIAEFRALLDSHGLAYGMFGHVDAGVLHVRPALDMKDPAQAALVRPISDAVAELTQRYGGLLWGEHGKGVRSEYAPAFFGELYPALQALKGAFDPHNQLNPGKICTPLESEEALLKVDEVTLRGDLDRTIDERVWQSYGTAVHCNGNGACYNYDPNDAMCPSWKATRQRQHSPKGRASLIREWLRLQGQAGVDVLAPAQRTPSFFRGLPERIRNSRAQRQGEQDFSHEVYDAMAGCLACKSCAGQCPIKVNVPEFRSRFLELYHGRYLRPARDYLIGSLEFTIPYLARFPALYNGLMNAGWVKKLLANHVGMVDSPLISRFDFQALTRRWNVRAATPKALLGISAEARERSVIIVQDAFTRYFETPLLAHFIELAARLGYQVFLAPFSANGKPLHVQGFLGAFNKAAVRNASQLQALSSFGVRLVGLDPAMTLVYRQEYQKVPGIGLAPKVELPQEWLLDALPERAPAAQAGRFRLLAHCTEKTNAPASSKQWETLFARAGLKLSTQATGCCGMSGTYGHEARNQETSRTIFDQSWARQVAAPAQEEGEALATGYSCRSQTKRYTDKTLRHPLEVLLQLQRG